MLKRPSLPCSIFSVAAYLRDQNQQHRRSEVCARTAPCHIALNVVLALSCAQWIMLCLISAVEPSLSCIGCSSSQFCFIVARNCNKFFLFVIRWMRLNRVFLWLPMSPRCVQALNRAAMRPLPCQYIANWYLAVASYILLLTSVFQ
jgi:hypothetical protein